MRYVVTESQYRLISEQWADKFNYPKGNIDKVALIFPQNNKIEEVSLNIFKKFGVVPGWFKNIYQALEVVENLKSKGVKAKELIIGSHGDGYKLIMTQGADLQQLLDEVKQIIAPNATVFFTACNGADDLKNLKFAAERLGIGAYGASGIYNPINNQAEKGFYFCSAKKLDTKALQSGAYSNEGLLSNGYCKKVPDSPIKWVNGVLQTAARAASEFAGNAAKGAWDVLKKTTIPGAAVDLGIKMYNKSK